jgi:chaperonin GroES
LEAEAWLLTELFLFWLVNVRGQVPPPLLVTSLNQRKEFDMNIRPLRDRIIVERVEEETTTAGGIIIPDSAKEKPQQGIIKAVGKGKVTEDGTVLPMDVKVGDRVLFGKYAGSEVKIDGIEYQIMREEDILGVLE